MKIFNFDFTNKYNIIYRYKKSYHEFFVYFGIYDFTILRLERNTWYHVYSIVLFNITLFKRVNYKAYQKTLDKFKKENDL